MEDGKAAPINEEEAYKKAQQLYQNRKMLSRNPIFVKNIYNTVEKEFETKKRFCK